MSPALIDTPPPPTQQQSSLLQNPNPKSRGNFDFTSNDFLSEHQIDSKFGNLGINEGNFSSRKPLSSGLSMPRFAKVRRNKGRSTTTSFEGGVDNESGMRDLRDRWNPFAASDKGFGSGSDDLGRGNAGFVFGGSSLSKEKNGVGENEGEVLLDELKKLNIGGSVKDDPFLGNVEFGKSSAGFVFGGSNSNVEKNGVGESEGKLSLHDEMMKLNIESSKNGETVEKASEINTFAFGKGSDSEFVFGLSNSNTEKTRIREKEDQSSSLPNEMTKLNIESSKNGEKAVKNKDASFNSKADDKSTFLFGQSSNAANRTSYGSSDSKLPDELKKLNIEDTTTAGNFNFMSNANNSFIFGSSKMNDDSTLGGSATTLADKLGKIKIYGHGTVEKVKKTSAFGSDKYDSNVCATNILPGERTKLKFGSTIEVSDGFPDTQFGNRTEELFNAPAFGGSIPSVCTSSTPMASGGSRVDPLFSVQLNNDSKLDTSFSSSSTFSFGFDIPSDEIKSRVSFTSTVSQSGTSHADFGKSSQDASGYLFTGLNQKMDFSAKRGGAKGTRLKKRQEKMRQPASGHHVVKDRSSQENPESPTCYSPMDFSPYQETLAADLNSRETSVASEISGDAIDEDLITATHSLNNNKDIQKGRNSSEESTTCFEKDDSANCPDEFVSGSRSECLNPNTEKVGIETYPQAGIPSNIKNEGSDGILQFSFASSSQDDRDTKFTFASSSTTSAQGNLSAAKRHYKKKNRTKSGLDSHSNAKVQLEIPCIPFVPFASSSPSSAPGQDQKEDPFKSHNIPVNKSKSDKEPEVVKQGTISSAAAVAAVQELCDKWRFRGNQAYANGNLSKAEDYYTRGVNCVLSDEISKSCLSALVLCYSNRAAARMSAGRMREALDDCARAAEIDSTFLRVQVRAANCHLSLGEIEEALKSFTACLPSGSDICLDRKIVIEASNGLQKAQQAAEHIHHCAELLGQRTSNDTEKALQIITEAMSISPYSEKLVEMKAEALFMLRKYEEVVQLCEQSLESAENNSAADRYDDSESVKNYPARLWRWCLMSKSYFYLGRLEEAIEWLEKLEQAVYVGPNMYGNRILESSSSLAVTVRELLRLKSAGNEAFLAGKHSEAVEHYTSALSCNVDSRPFTAICFCNRAAALQALSQISDAIADCSLAIALDGYYQKAISRRATLHEMIRDYGQATNDLQKLISLLEKQTEDKPNQSPTLGKSSKTKNDLKQARLRLSSMEEESRKGVPLDMYLILGIEPSGTASDIKKAYRKAALRHHPDKAGQFLARSENGDDWVWKEIAEEVHKDADRLFKMIGEAYAVLSDPEKRSRYDLEEEIRNSKKKGSGSSSQGTPSEAYNYPFERSGSRRYWKEVRKPYGNSYHQWSEAYHRYY